jgi:hypothetical protein
MSANKYQSPIERNNAFMAKVEDLVREIIIQNNIPFYRIESRMDHQPDAADGQHYLPVIRIITYFEDSVDPIAAVLRQEFDVEVEAPKRDKEIIKVDSFSSKHIEYKVTLKANRLELIEYKRYGTKQFEIQACSMIQDAWNCIEKELGYNGGKVPEEARRDFYRVGAILEMADIEFLKIRGLLHVRPEERPAPEETYIPQRYNIEEVYAAEPMETPQTVADIFRQQPEAYQPEPVRMPEPIRMTMPEPEQQQPVVAPQPEPAPQAQAAMNGLAPHKVSVAEVADTIAASMPVANNKPRMSDFADRLNEIKKDFPEYIVNMVPAMEAAVPPPPPAPQPEPAPAPVTMYNYETGSLNVNANGAVEKTPEPVKEQPQPVAQQPQPVQMFEEKPKNNPQTIDENAQMTDASLKEYVRNSKLLKEIDTQIATRASAKLNDEIDIEGDVERLRFLKVHSLKQLHERLADNKNDIIAFAEKWIGKDNGGSFDMGISLFYLEYLLVGKRNDPGFAVEYVLKFISDNDYSARYIIPTYNSIRQSADSSISKFSHLTLK